MVLTRKLFITCVVVFMSDATLQGTHCVQRCTRNGVPPANWNILIRPRNRVGGELGAGGLAGGAAGLSTLRFIHSQCPGRRHPWGALCKPSTCELLVLICIDASPLPISSPLGYPGALGPVLQPELERRQLGAFCCHHLSSAGHQLRHLCPAGDSILCLASNVCSKGGPSSDCRPVGACVCPSIE